MTGKLARYLRSLNANLVVVDNFVIEKILKGFYLLSTIIYRRKIRNAGSGTNLVLINNFDRNIRMKIDISRTMGCSIYWTGYHEFREMMFLHRFLQDDMVFADVGANQGEFTLFAAKRLVNGKVLSFEPLPSIHEALVENIKLNGFSNIMLFNFGLADREGSFTIHEFEGENEGLATLYPGDKKSKRMFEVSLKTLDEVFESTGLSRLDFIKMDIEGAELAALNGSLKTIRKFRPVIMIEVNTDSYLAAGYSSEDVLAFFTINNYKPFEIAKRGKLKPCSSLPAFGNIIFQPA